MSLSLVIGNKNYSSWSMRPWLFLKYHGMPFTEIRIPLYREDSKDQLLNYSPSGKVPVLLDGESKVWDSLAILEYLAERFPQTQGWPEDTALRAQARSLAAEMHSGFTALRANCSMDCRRLPEAKPLPNAVMADIARIVEIWRLCRLQHSQAGPWLFGRFTIADAMFAPVAIRFHSYQIKLNDEAQSYLETILENEAVKDWIAAGRLETEVIEF